MSVKRISELTFLIWILPAVGFAANPLASDWWLKGSPELVLSNAQAVTRNLVFFHAEKLGSPYSQITNPFAKTNENARVELFQRKNADGSVETKEIILAGNFQTTIYGLKNGRYEFVLGQVIKMEFLDGEALENSIAETFPHPYEYKLLKPAMSGTNDCIVVARCMTPKFLDAIKAIYYKNYTKEQEAAFGGDFRKFIRSETDYYIRKSDAVIIGYIKRNHLGEELEDWLYDKVDINQPIADQEFSLPSGEIEIAQSSDEFRKMFHELMAAKMAKSRHSIAADLSEKRVAELPWAANLPKALERAKTKDKIVLLDFTGSDWCVWCIRFDDDILSKPEFTTYAKTNLIMVLVDFPNAKKQSNDLKKRNAELQTKFKVNGFPTYVVLNSDGKEIGRQVGYLSGGPLAFIAKLEQFKKH
jgi:thioredoxin-related protein